MVYAVPVSENLFLAFMLTAIAGLSTGVGSAMAFFTRRTNTRFMAGSLGFSAGVMIYVSFVEMLPEAREALAAAMGEGASNWSAAGGFFGGIVLIAIIDWLVPEYENPHHARSVENMDEPQQDRRLERMGLMAAVAIAIHNFPEGLATFTSALVDPGLGISVAVAIAIHNIPEGIAVSVPIFYATGSRKKAFWLSFASGLSEPAGAALGYLLLMSILTPTVFGFLLAGVAGIMVFISLDELLPAAREYGGGHLAIYGLIGGMAVMALSLLLLH